MLWTNRPSRGTRDAGADRTSCLYPGGAVLPTWRGATLSNNIVRVGWTINSTDLITASAKARAALRYSPRSAAPHRKGGNKISLSGICNLRPTYFGRVMRLLQFMFGIICVGIIGIGTPAQGPKQFAVRNL